MLSILLLPPVELNWWEQQIHTGLAAIKPHMETTYKASLEVKIHLETVMWSTQWLSERECCWDTRDIAIMAYSSAREAEKRLIFCWQWEMSLHLFFFPPHRLPIVFLPCSTLTLLCFFFSVYVWWTWLGSLTPSSVENSCLKEQGTGGQDENPASCPEQGIPVCCNSSADSLHWS